MTAEEFSNEFDVLYNNIASNLAPGLDEYEKSLFLTRALNMIVKNYFNPANNTELEGFDQTPKRLMDFSKLIITETFNTNGAGQFDARAKRFPGFTQEPLMVINEFGVTNTGKKIVGLPAPYQTYTALMSKPYKYPPKEQAWRLLLTSNDTRYIEVLTDPKYTLTAYSVRYVKFPYPIILTTLSDDLTIEGKTVPYCEDVDSGDQACELAEELHWEILLKAVELATAVYKLGTPASDSEPQQAKEKANSQRLLRQ